MPDKISATVRELAAILGADIGPADSFEQRDKARAVMAEALDHWYKLAEFEARTASIREEN